jgi:ATP-dependent DNA helicase UvrD/PcrA
MALDRTSPFSPRPPGERRPASLLDVRLDPAQREIVALAPERAVLILGEAGHGKTTVALHRLAHIWRASNGGMRAAVVVPTDGLARLVQPLLRRLGVDVEAVTYDRWARTQARCAFRDVPRLESELTPVSVQRMKRDRALRVALAELALRPRARVDDDGEAPRGPASTPRVGSQGRAVRPRALAGRGDLQHLFGDRVLLEDVARTSGALPAHAVAETLEHTRVQFSLTAEREYAHVVDRKRLMAVDRRALDEGTGTGNAGRVDVEDYAVLFELDRLRAERTGSAARAPRAHDALLLDEAQELAPLELALLGRSVRRGGSLIVAGDMDQQTDPTTSFAGWHAAMSELGVLDYSAVRLDIGYRCPPGIVDLARAVLGEREPDRDDTPAAWPQRVRDLAAGPAIPRGVEPVCAGFEEERDLVAQLGRDLRTLLRHDRHASVLVVCRSPLTARRFASALQPEVPARLVFDGHFLPRGPVQVTTVDEVKGLEFDFVVIPDATAAEYPDTPSARRALYVAITRARHQVLVAHAGPRSPLLPLSFGS